MGVAIRRVSDGEPPTSEPRGLVLEAEDEWVIDGDSSNRLAAPRPHGREIRATGGDLVGGLLGGESADLLALAQRRSARDYQRQGNNGR